jgi:xanthine dehydrogenase molybdopterin-binding subunit B
MEPGNATVLVPNDRVDIWIGDQSPQETRFSASKITGVPEQNVYIHLCHLGGGYGRNGNGPQAEQAIMIANQMRGTPVHMLWTREEDFIGTTYRAMGMARLKAGLDAEGWPIRARGPHLHAARRVRSRGFVRRDVALSRAELSLFDPHTNSTSRSGRGAASVRPRTSSIGRAS